MKKKPANALWFVALIAAALLAAIVTTEVLRTIQEKRDLCVQINWSGPPPAECAGYLRGDRG